MLEEKILKTCKEMFNQRNYEYEEKKDENLIIYKKKDGNKMCLFLNLYNKLDINIIKDVISRLNKNKINHAILIYKNDITSYAKKILINIKKEFEIEIFKDKNLMYNITKHKLVPLHEELSVKDSKKFTKKYGKKLPVILKNDPVSKFYNFKKGSIIKVTRSNNYIIYRIVK